MITKSRSWALIALTILAGCIPTLNPVYTSDQLVNDSRLPGTWTSANGEETWEFSEADGMSYRLVYTDRQGRQSRFAAHLANVEGTLFLDLFPEDPDGNASGFQKFHQVPIHTVYLVKQQGPDLQLAAIDFKWLDSYLAENPDAIQSATFNGRRLITASTEELQAFVVEHREQFTNDLELTRRQ